MGALLIWLAAAARGSSPRRPWWRFLLSAVPVSVLMGSLIPAALGRYEIAIDPQVHRCLPGHHVYLVDRARHEVSRGDIVAFLADGQTPLEPAGEWIGKIAIGLPGDHVRVTAQTVEVNGRVVGTGLLLASRIGVTDDALVRELVVPPGHVWAMGETVDSYDSRYYGPIGLWKMRGTATALF
jgi:conjugal transfer pilin signal peptidase TrbI